MHRFLREHGDNTVIAIVGDHGPHYANRYPIREVSEIHAAFEVVNPVAAFILPKTMTQEKPEAEKHLKNNAVSSFPRAIALLRTIDIPATTGTPDVSRGRVLHFEVSPFGRNHTDERYSAGKDQPFADCSFHSHTAI